MRALSLLFLAMLVLAARANPVAAQASSADVTFYGHVFFFGLDTPMPANTQFPKGEANLGIGGSDPCTSHVDLSADNPAGGNCQTQAGNKLVLYSTAGFVQIADLNEFFNVGYGGLHNEHGSTKDVLLDTSKPVTASVFVSMDLFGVPVGALVGDYNPDTLCPYPNPKDTACLYPYWGWDPAVYPDVVVRAKLYYAVLGGYGESASEQPAIQEALESGQATLVAGGETHAQLVTNGLPGSPNVHEYVIDLGAPQVEAIPKEANFFLVYEFLSNSGGTDWNNGDWRIWAGEFYPPRFTLPTRNAFAVESVIPQAVHGKLAILASINTPWGSYDVDPTGTRVEITNGAGRTVDPARMEVVAEYKVAHGAHYKPVNVTFIWDYHADKLPADTYTVTVHARNHQNSAGASCAAKFTIGAAGRVGSVEVGLCGDRTDARFFNQTAKPGPDASGGAGGPKLHPGIPALGPLVGGIAVMRRKRA